MPTLMSSCLPFSLPLCICSPSQVHPASYRAAPSYGRACSDGCIPRKTNDAQRTLRSLSINRTRVMISSGVAFKISSGKGSSSGTTGSIATSASVVTEVVVVEAARVGLGVSSVGGVGGGGAAGVDMVRRKEGRRGREGGRGEKREADDDGDEPT
jgi:hypothetical protein